ncbi:uncharacterized protein ACN427_005137 [Glossina fuscipes fuscipes]|uniref:Uncharacterized protein n=1 Tax=Glossina palpalis gambiensis TaxID=67801 RepID=A0A1B0AVX2_9MUSC
MFFKNFTFLSFFVICIFALTVNEAEGTTLVRINTSETLLIWKSFKEMLPNEIVIAIDNLMESIKHTLPPQVISAMKSVLEGIFLIIKELSPAFYHSITSIMENIRIINETMLPKIMTVVAKYLQGEQEISIILKHLSMLLRQLVPFIENVVSRLAVTVS